MKDRFGREIGYMRISVTDRCNFRCKYCMPEKGVPDIGHDSILKFEEIMEIVGAAAELGISKYRLTGGEPLVRKGITACIKGISAIPGVSEITMTTNGSLLAPMAGELAKAGLSRINVSLDTLKPNRFKEITRGGDLDQVFAAINEAKRAGLAPVKLNTVIMKGFNDDEILDFVQLTIMHEMDVRFIELMPVGQAAGCGDFEYMSCEEIKSKLPALRPIQTDGGVASLYKYPMARGKIGFISPISDCFCTQCNKLRLTADGKLKTCLHSDQEIDLKPALGSGNKGALKEIIEEAIIKKEEKHRIAEGLQSNRRNMNKIGG